MGVNKVSMCARCAERSGGAALTLPGLRQHCPGVPDMGHDNGVADNDGGYGRAAVIPIAARVCLQVALVRLGECFSCTE